MQQLPMLDTDELRLRDRLAYDLFVKCYDKSMNDGATEMLAYRVYTAATTFVTARQAIDTEQ